MRTEGTIRSWNDERGFGFIFPARGGPDIFFHISDFPRRRGRPQVGDQVSFVVEMGRECKLRAGRIELLPGSGRAPVVGSYFSRVRKSLATLVAIPVFVLIYGAVERLWQPSILVAAWYGLASAATFLLYASDKLAAISGSWRVAESSLHTLALVGGWPGALLAQVFLRHKSSKAGFRATFWATVVLNILLFVLLCFYLGDSSQTFSQLRSTIDEWARSL